MSKQDLAEIVGSIQLPKGGTHKLRKFFSFFGPGLLVSVGYMDPGNWATDISAGSRFGYSLLFVIFISNIFAMILQYLSLKLGIATGKDLAQMCKAYFPRYVSLTLWILAEIAIIATDLAEIIGSAVAFELLFGIPLQYGVFLTVANVLLILLLQNYGFRKIELFVGSLVFLVMICFMIEMFITLPNPSEIASGFIPSFSLFTDTEKLAIGIGILGATVMPHNLFLHSAIVQSRNYAEAGMSKSETIKYATWDSTISLFLAFFVNAAILIVAAGSFYTSGQYHIVEIDQAYQMLDTTLSSNLASRIFGIALLLAGLNSTITGTLAGQIVMEGFLYLKMKPWKRRLLTRALALIPALIGVVVFKDVGVTQLLIMSQIVLSLQLGFAIVPLAWFTSRLKIMGEHVNTLVLNVSTLTIVCIIVGLNIYFLISALLN